MLLKDARIAVLYGGRCAEREVSLESGGLILNALKQKGYDAFGIDLYGARHDRNPIDQLRAEPFDIAFIGLHGGEGEDGHIQALLDLMSKPYTGSRQLACALAMDKLMTKKLWKGLGIPTPDYIADASDVSVECVERQLSYPVIVKPSREGSTIGISKADNTEQLMQALRDAREYDSEILVEEFIEGPEFTVSIINDEAYPAIGLKPSEDHQLYDYEAKYLADDTEYRLPSGLSDDDESRLKALSLDAYLAVGCKGWGRVDVMRRNNGDFSVLEVNTSPGMTSHSLVPMAAAHVGISYQDLVEKILCSAWDSVGSI
ncbi:D-alanine--D-alanine ligase [Marinomonas mediterranea]|jgi:D-alanine--D-alanine ligase (EC 6.3.2.4)|uniref:D-alanine--D-alanine ligase n=1 Tax=Marinomonas mediterranea (strain ATCC 700492 / JCM 21426 / NBRC 103028 / MMB-1) TaxID=717774 RepID=F2JVW6_MARM1|nr:D-alanine--D-alanine ligase [Marinomonas mediterranea]ADZ91752.1 D-alanine--D-alanine ligase [Marinomonas mediterranea MMB-1]WCN09710.1 D-alanine--D-alanine ligase [Marinomonas mediterranea]WCN13791.1 D-alanine--D-alanine ligase [Marinomonas mediterranea]WCN17847.1 D-alanine--D-alanine ligase [Marinomonas mediterranea MMB-1]